MTSNIDLSSSALIRSSLSILLHLSATVQCICRARVRAQVQVPRVFPNVFTLELYGGLWSLRIEYVMVVAVRAVFVTIFFSVRRRRFEGRYSPPILILAAVFAEALLALLTGKDHFKALLEGVVGLLLVAFCAVEPLAACQTLLHVVGDIRTEDLQHGERMATWAFRMCLLRRRVSAEVCGVLESGTGLPHGEKHFWGTVLRDVRCG